MAGDGKARRGSSHVLEQLENMRRATWCLVEEVRSGDWGIAGNPLTTGQVRALAGGGV
ncbi:MAG: 4-oxalocrotonate tautomerase [Gaiellales bacterium]|nr:4-oxalocrotonate tautomerase [Gaiellales bacterium]